MESIQVQQKICRSCGENLPLSSFYGERTGVLGVRAVCKKCRPKPRNEFDPAKAGTISCAGCHLTYAHTPEFFYKHAQSKNGLYRKCKRCMDIEAKAYNKSHPPSKNRAAVKRRCILKKVYGLTSDEFDQMMLSQNHRCAICRTDIAGVVETSKRRKQKAVVDHDHKTGAVRELLCGKCNTALGMIGDDIDVARTLINYLVKHKQ